jgi:amidase
MTQQQFDTDIQLIREKMRENIEKCLKAGDADFIVANGESLLTTVAMAAGYPIAAAPLGFADFNGRAFGLEILARSGEEDKLFKFLSAWEKTFPDAVKPPPRLVPATKLNVHAEL